MQAGGSGEFARTASPPSLGPSDGFSGFQASFQEAVTRATIEGTGYDPTNLITHEISFTVDLKSGRSLIPSPVHGGERIW
jgi:hypothetical protein